MDASGDERGPRARPGNSSASADEFAWMAKPLPPEPIKWVRLRPTWRWWAVQVLSLFLATVVVLGWLIPRRSGVSAPASFFWTCAVIGAAWIVAVLPGSVVDRMLAARLEAARRGDPARPWNWDHRWDPRGVSGSPFRRLIVSSPGSIWLVFYSSLQLAFGRPAELYWFFGIAGATAATWMACKAWRIYGVGTAYVSFTKFPFHPGERVTLHFGMSAGGAQFERAAFCLRRIEVAPGFSPLQTRGARRHSGMRLDRPPGELPGSDHHVTIEFDLPEDVAGTHLSASPPAYWTLDVIANTSAGPYTESFLIPIYERPAAPDEA